MLAVVCLIALCGCVRVEFSYDGKSTVADGKASDVQNDDKVIEKSNIDKANVDEALEKANSDELNSDDTIENASDDEEETAEVIENVNNDEETEETLIQYEFRNDSLWKEHFKKHGEEFPYETKEDYLAGANKALSNPNILHKLEGEDGDHVYYLEETNEIIFVSKDGYIRTYFKPTKGKKYFDKQ